MIISYSQNNEDILLWRALSNIENGFYVDVGANHPQNDSVTRLFYEAGWRGINIEPLEECYNLLREHRPEDVNLRVAVTDKMSTQTFYEVMAPGGAGLSTLDANIAHEHHEKLGYEVKEYCVQTSTLNQILLENKYKEIHFLKIDVEGGECDVLKSIDLNIHRPWVIVVEATHPNSTEKTHNQWENILLQNQYQFIFFDGLNRFYLADEHRNLANYLNYPVCVFDNYIRYNDYLEKKLNQDLEKELLQIKDKNIRITEKYEHIKIVLQDTHSSLSWRITSPLRRGNALLKNLKYLLKKNWHKRQVSRL